MTFLRHRLVSLIAVLCALAPLAASASESPTRSLSEFEAAYKVRASVASGDLTMSLKAAEDGAFLFRTLTRPRGLVRIFARGEIDESSTIVYQDASVVPLDYTLTDTISKNRDARISFDWPGGIVVGVERGEEVGAELKPGMLNRAALYVALMQDLQNDRLPDSYVLFDRGRVKTYELSQQGVETVEVPYGRFEAVKLVRESDESRRSMHLWCAPALDYLPVRIDLYKEDKRVSRAELKAVEGLPSA